MLLQRHEMLLQRHNAVAAASQRSALTDALDAAAPRSRLVGTDAEGAHAGVRLSEGHCALI
eukprot:6207688-Pleurochrysis_carterae.AAC.6